MPKSFSVTGTQPNLMLGAGEQVDLVFTVTNLTGHTRRARLDPKSQGNTQGQWLQVVGERTREFSPMETQQVTVRATIPQETSAGAYPFRLYVVLASAPDEDFTEGPSVTIEVGSGKAPPKKPFPWWIPAVIGVVLVIGGVIGYVVCCTEKPLVVDDGAWFDQANNVYYQIVQDGHDLTITQWGYRKGNKEEIETSTGTIEGEVISTEKFEEAKVETDEKGTALSILWDGKTPTQSRERIPDVWVTIAGIWGFPKDVGGDVVDIHRWEFKPKNPKEQIFEWWNWREGETTPKREFMGEENTDVQLRGKKVFILKNNNLLGTVDMPTVNDKGEAQVIIFRKKSGGIVATAIKMP